jgi:hypothetical protein
MSNVIYIISHAGYGKDIYKIGFTTKAKGLMQRYRTYYPDDPIIEHQSPVSEPRLAEKLLFHWLRDFRVHPSKEFFTYDLDKLRTLCNEVVKVVDLTESYFE